MSLAATFLEPLGRIEVVPRRMLLETADVHATVPMLRGVWGAALHDLDGAAYEAVFSGSSGSVPGYILRPAPPDPLFAPAIEWILIGAAQQHDESLRRAWDIASGMGLGRERRRFHIRQIRGLDSDGNAQESVSPWSLDQVAWPIEIPSPCRLRFPVPVRLLRNRALIASPSLTDLIVAACRRVAAFLPPDRRDDWKRLTEAAIDHSRTIPTSVWAGDRLDLLRYSGRQKRELEIQGVTGFFDLPEGPGPLWPLFAVAQWLHLGKSTVVGLGQLLVEPT